MIRATLLGILLAACSAVEPNAARDGAVDVARNDGDDSSARNRGAVIVNETGLPLDHWGNDPFELEMDSDAPFVSDGTLTLTVSHAGGCARHDFTLVANGSFEASQPPQLVVSLAHDANGDTCEAYLTDTYDFDLTPIGLRYARDYGRSDGEIRLLLRGPVPFARSVELAYTFQSDR